MTPKEFVEPFYNKFFEVIETDTDEDLQAEINQWETASDEDLLKFEDALGENR